MPDFILCETPKGCTCGAPADTPAGMHHDHCRVNPAKPDGSGCRVCKIAPSANRTPPACSCSDGPYYGAQRADEPVRCLRCGLPAPALSQSPEQGAGR